MMVIIEILIYFFFATVMSWLASLGWKHEREKVSFSEDSNDLSVYEGSSSHWNVYLTWFVIFFTVIAGIRWNVGSDSIAYAVMFRDNRIAEGSTEPLFQLMIKLVNECGFHFSVGLGLMAFIQIYFITKSLERYQYILIFIPFVLFGGRYWQDLMGACRQMMAACIFMWALKFVVERRMIHYFIIIGICYLIHNSSLLLLPIYFIPVRLRILQHRYILLTILLVCVIIGQSPSFAALASYVEEFAIFIGYDRNATVLSDSLKSDVLGERLSFGPIMLSFLLISMYIIWYGPVLEEKYETQMPQFYLWYNISFFYASAYFLVCNLGHIFIRPIQYLELAQMYMTSLTLWYLLTEWKQYGGRPLSAILFIVIVELTLTWGIVKSGASHNILVYKTFFFQ